MSDGVVVWLTGLPASGKSTLAGLVRERVTAGGRACCVLDGDDVRTALVPAPGYSEREREDFYRTLANLAGLLADQGLAVLVPATAHRRVFRHHARQRAPRFIEVYVATPLAECMKRDVKQLYARAASQENDTLPGHGVAYEPPDQPEVVATGGRDEAAAARIAAAVGT